MVRAALAAAVLLGVVSVAATEVAAEPGGIVISELHYHAGTDLDSDDFLEIANTSTAPVDVAGWAFTEGVTTSPLPAGSILPAGGHAIVAKDAARFQELYGFAPLAAYSGNLSNGGETVALVDGAGAVVDTVTYADADPWPMPPDGEGPSLELRRLMSDNTLAESWGASVVDGGTPGRVNSIDGTTAPPRASQVTATPQRPDPSQPIVVSARLPVGSTATLRYKVMFAADVNAPLLDGAASPGGAGDGVYSATIPGQAAGRLVRYRIDATSAGVAFSHPAATDSIRYEGVVVRNPAVTTNLPLIEWFMEDAVYQDLLANHRYDNVEGEAVLAYDGRVWDNVRMRIRGNTSRTRPKVSWKVEMPSGHDFDMPDLPYPLDEFAIQREPEPFADVGWDIVGEAGARRLTILPVRTHRNGQFWSVGKIMETMDGAWRDDQDVDDWAIYKGEAGALTRTASPQALEDRMESGCPLCEPEQWLEKKTREDEDYTDVWTLSQVLDAPASASQRAWIDQNVDIPVMVNYMAINSLIRHADSGWYNWWVARDTEGTGRWQLWHWDLNWIFTVQEDDDDGIFVPPYNSNRFTGALLRYADVRDMYFRRLRTLADEFLVPPGIEQRWDALANRYLSDWNLDRSVWGGYTPAGARAELLDGLAERRAVINQSGIVPPSQSATPDVVINEIMYRPRGGDAAEYVELHNPSSTEAVDISGWTLDGIDLTIRPGTVVLPGGHAVFVKQDTAFRQTYGGAGRFVAGEYPGALADGGATLTLRQGTRVVDTVAYGPAAPWPAAANGSGPSLELRDPATDNAVAGNWWANPAITGTPGAANSTPPGPDTTPPSVPGALTAPTVGGAQVALRWGAATDNRGVLGYFVFRDGQLVGATTGLTYTDTGLAPGTTYAYAVAALDTSWNGGPASTLTVTTSSDPAALFSETWSRPDGSTWGPSWTSGASSGSVSVQAGTGELAVTNTSGAFARSQLTGFPARTASDTVFSYRWSSGTPSAYLNVFTRGSGGWRNGYRPVNGYGLQFASNSSTVALTRSVNGSTTTLHTASGAQQVGTAKQWVRLRVSGSTVQYKTWVDGQSEPAAWRATVTDAAVSAGGQLFMSLNRGSSNSGTKTVRVDDLAIR